MELIPVSELRHARPGVVAPTAAGEGLFPNPAAFPIR